MPSRRSSGSTVHIDLGFKPCADDLVSADAYGEILDKTVIICTDVLIVTSNCVVLAPRTTLPAAGFWMIGGRIHHGTTSRESACAHFERDTGEEIQPANLRLLGTFEYMFKLREQAPQENGTHTVVITYSYMPTEGELHKLLSHDTKNANEYTGKLKLFSRTDIYAAFADGTIDPAFQNVYNAVFSV